MDLALRRSRLSSLLGLLQVLVNAIGESKLQTIDRITPLRQQRPLLVRHLTAVHLQ